VGIARMPAQELVQSTPATNRTISFVRYIRKELMDRIEVVFGKKKNSES
jgi:hypothetical protein